MTQYKYQVTFYIEAPAELDLKESLGASFEEDLELVTHRRLEALRIHENKPMSLGIMTTRVSKE